MSSLKDLIAQVKSSEGVGKLIVMFQIRTYIQQQTHLSILKEISEIWDGDDLKILMGAGMPGELYYATIAQGARIRGMI